MEVKQTMSDKMPDNKCKQVLENGKQCNAYALKGQDYCFSHSPENKDAKLEAVRKGGLVKQIEILSPLKEIDVEAPKDVVKLLNATISEVRRGELDPRIANTIGYLTGHLLRALEVSETNKKLDEIKAVLIGRQ